MELSLLGVTLTCAIFLLLLLLGTYFFCTRRGDLGLPLTTLAWGLSLYTEKLEISSSQMMALAVLSSTVTLKYFMDLGDRDDLDT